MQIVSIKLVFLLLFPALFAACGGGGSSDSAPGPVLPAAITTTHQIQLWSISGGAVGFDVKNFLQ